jgi:hypothetical protein
VRNCFLPLDEIPLFYMKGAERERHVSFIISPCPTRGRMGSGLIRMMVRAGYVGGKGKKGIYDFYREILTGTCPVPPRAG